MIRVLVVDDSPGDRQWLAGLLARSSDYEVITAANGEEAIRLVAEYSPHVIVTDMLMPGMNGLELVAALRQAFPGLPVILVTAHGSEDLALEALRRGASSYVAKSWAARRLLPTVHQVAEAAVQRAKISRLNQYLQHCGFSFSLASDCQLLKPILNFVHGLLECLELDSGEITRINIALQEALSNAVFHGNLELSSALREEDEAQYFALAERRRKEPPYCHRRVHFHGELSRQKLEFVIRDEGPGFDPSVLPNPDDPESLQCPCGRGLLLIHSFMDEVSFNERGNEIRLVKRLAEKGTREQAEVGPRDTPETTPVR